MYNRKSDKRDCEIKMGSQLSKNDMKQLADDNASMQKQLRDILSSLEKNKTRIDELSNSIPDCSENDSSCDEGDNSPNLGNLPTEQDVKYFLLCPLVEENISVHTTPVCQKTITVLTTPQWQKNITVLRTPVPQKNSVNGVPQIPFLDLEEFASIPQYMKGRLRIEAINDFIQVINNAVFKKYSLLKLPRNQIPWRKWKSYRAYRSLEDESVKGIKFITPRDIRVNPLDNKIKILFAILRHVKRIKQTRDRGVIRICLIEY